MGTTHRFRTFRQTAGGVLVCIVFLCKFATADSQALTDAKRRAANDLLRANKTAEAIVMLQEVVSVDGRNYRDFLALGRAHDKLSASAEALANYRMVLTLVAADAKSPEERAARSEAERRVKVFDQQSAKIDTTVDELLRKLVALEKEAETARTGASAERLYRIHAALLLADARPDRGGAEIPANRYEWTNANFRLEKGKTYKVSCKGTWRLSNRADEECNAEGLSGREYEGRPVGSVVAAIAGVADGFAAFGPTSTFVAPATGPLLVTCWEKGADKKDNTGTIYLLIEQVK